MSERDQMDALDWMLVASSVFLGLALGAGMTAAAMKDPPGYACTARATASGECLTWTRKP